MLQMVEPLKSCGRRRCVRELPKSAILFLKRLRRKPSRHCATKIGVTPARLLHTGGVSRRSTRRNFLKSFGNFSENSGKFSSGRLGTAAIGRAVSCGIERYSRKELVGAINIVAREKLPNKILQEIFSALLHGLGGDAQLLARTCLALERCEHLRDPRFAEMCIEALAVQMEELNWWTIEAYCCLARMQPRLVVGNEKIDTNAEMIEKIFAAVCEMHASRSDIFGEIMIAAAKLNAQPSERVQHLLAVKASDGIGKVGSVRKLLQLADATQRQDLIDYCLLHDIAKEATKFLGKMEIFQLVQILGIFARSEVFDGEFMDKARERFLNLLAREKPEVTAQQLLVMMTVVSRLNTCLDPEQEILDLLCVRAKRYASTLNETATTQLLLAVQKRRPILSSAVRDLLAAVGERNLSDWSASNSATVFCTLSKLSNFSEKLAIGCLRTIKKKGTGKLAAAQIQQLLAVLSHHMEEIPEPIMKSTLKSLLESLCRPAVIASLNQVQIVALLTAFSKLKIRPETATGALIRALTNDPEFTEEIKFQKKISTIGERKFSVMKMVEFLTAENQLDPAHWTSVLAAIEDLKIWNSTTVHICLILRSLLLHNGLHGLRAIHLAQAMKPFCNREWLDLATNEFVGEVDEEVERALEHLTEVNGHRFESGGENIWLAEFGRACIGALQRHEVYLISTWSVLTSVREICAKFSEIVEILPQEKAFLRRLDEVASEEETEKNREKFMEK